MAKEAIKRVHNPVRLTFENINYEVTVKYSKEEAKAKGSRFGKYQVIKNASGYALPGQTLFIMGASGAGKTSLLNILSDRVSIRRGSKLSGDISLNDTTKLT